MKNITDENAPKLIPNTVGDDNSIDPLNALNWSISGRGLDDYQTKSDVRPIWFDDMLFDTSIIIDASNNMNPLGFMLANAIEVLRQAISGAADEIDVMHSNSFGIICHSSLHAVSANNVKFHGKTSGLQFALNHTKYNNIIFITGGLSASGPVVVPEEKNIIVWDISGSTTDYSAYAIKTVSNRDPVAAMNEILQYYIDLEQSESEKQNMTVLVVEHVSTGVRIIPNPDNHDSAAYRVALKNYIRDPQDHDFSDEVGIAILPQKIKNVTIVVDGSASMTLVEDYLIGVLKIIPAACDEISVEIIHTFAEGILIHSSVKSKTILEIEYASGGEGLSLAYANAKYDDILLITDGHITDIKVTIPEGKKISEWVIKKPDSFEMTYAQYVEKIVNEMIEYYNPDVQPIFEKSEGVVIESSANITDSTPVIPDWYITHQWTTNMLAEFSDLSIEQIAKLRRMAINNIYKKDNLDEQLTAMRSLYPYFKNL